MEGDELLGIGQFAQRCGLAVSAVRFYADTGVLAPAEVDPASGYRRYRTSQISDAVQIRQLRQLGMPLADTRRLLALPATARARELREWRASFMQTTRSTITVVEALITEMDEGDPMTTRVTARDWYQAIRQVVPAAGRGDRPTLASVLVERRPDALRLVATDALRLCVRDIVPADDPAPTTGSVHVHAGDLTVLWSAPGDPDRAVEIDIGASGLVVRDGEKQTTLSRAEGDYPDYGSLLDAVPASVPAVAARGELAAALLSFGPVAAIEITIGRDRMRLSLPDQSQHVAVACDYVGEPVRVGVQPRFVVDALQAMSGPDVAVDVSGAVTPIALRSADDGSVLTLVMPVLLQD